MSYLIYSLIFIFASIISIILGIYGFLNRDKHGMAAFSIFMFLFAIWPMVQAFDIATADLTFKILLMKIRFDAPIFAGLAYLVMVLQLIGHSKWITKERLIILGIIPILGAIFNWISPNILFRYDFHVSLNGPFPVLLWSNGPLFWIYILYLYALYLVPIFLLANSYRTISPLSSRKILILIFAISIPLFTDLLFRIGITPIFGFNITPLTQVFLGLILVWGVFYVKAFDTVPIARGKIISSMDDGVVVFDLKSLIIDINPSAKQMIGPTALSAVGKPALEVFAPWPDLLSRFKDVHEEHTEIKSENPLRYFDINIIAIKDNNGLLLGRMVILRDITERRIMENELNESEIKYHSLYSSMSEGVAIHDIVYNSNNEAIDYIITDINHAYESILGINRSEAIGKKASKLYGTGKPPYIEIYADVAVKGTSKEFETYFEQAEKYFRISVTSPEKGKFATIFEDITKRKQSDLKIERNQKLLDAINQFFIESLNYDSEKQVIQKGLEMLEKLTESEFGFYSEFNENRHLDDKLLQYPAGDLNNTTNADELLKNKEINSYWMTVTGEKSEIINNPEPDIIGLSHSNPPITSFIGVPLKEGDNPIGMIALANKKVDYVEDDKLKVESFAVAFVEVLLRKRAEIVIKDNLKELEQSNKELEQFAHITSHDLREPLRMITSFLQLLERRYKNELDQEANEFIGYAVDGAKRLDAMTNDLLQYSKINSEKRDVKPVDFEKVLDLALLNLKVQIETNNAIITHDLLPTINGDEELKVQLFQNLISNSIKYRSQEIPKIHISAIKEKNQYLFSIKDNGIGMSSEHLKRIFTIFQRLHTREEYEGTGIGLAIAQKIVYQQGGKIWVESELGKGSTFYFTIPN